MHILFYHQNYPAQFGHVGGFLAKNRDYRCTFVSERPPALDGNIERIQYKTSGGATKSTHYCSRTFENATWHAWGLYEALKARPDIKPDLIVGHSGFGSTIFLRELYDCPIINYFEYFYRARSLDMDFRPDFPAEQLNQLRARTRNAMLLIDLENCNAGYSPTTWQRNCLPEIFHPKVDAIFDGIDTRFWRPKPNVPREVPIPTTGANERLAIPKEMKVVTYVSRGMESMRGFDIFMKAAKLICQRRNDVVILVVGEDRVCYGGDERITGMKSFKDWVLSKDHYDLDRIRFLGRVPPQTLVDIFSLSDVHFYLTVPFVLSWSLMDSLSCGAKVIASDTGPVREMIQDGHNGLLVDFFDYERMADRACEILDAPEEFAHLGVAGRQLIEKNYSMDLCLPRMEALYQRVLNPPRVIRKAG